MLKFKWFIFGAFFSWVILPLIVYAANVSVPQSTQKGDLPTGQTTGNYQLLHPGSNGQVLYASSTSANGLVWAALPAGSGATTTINNATGPSFTFATTSDTNLLLNITSGGSVATFTPVWTGTLAAARLNSNVVQGVTNDTNVTGSISAQNLTLGWTGVLAASRGGIGTTTLGSLTGGTQVTVTGGQNVLIGTSTQISLGSNVVTTLATGTAGNIFNGSISSNTLTLNLPTASSANTGQLSSTDWTTFNNKQATISVTAPITLTGASVGIVNQGTTSQVLHGNASGNASFGSVVNADIANSTIDLTAKVTGVLPLANGGIATTTLGSLTVGTGLSVTGGQKVLVGTSTQISLGTNVVTSVVNDTNVTGSISSNALTLGWTGVLAVARGGIGTTTLGNLTVSSSNLSITGGSQVLIGTSTQITLTNTPTFGNATFTGVSSLATTSITSLVLPNVSGTQCLHSVSGVVSGTGSDCGSGGGGGSISTSTNAQIGKVAVWTGLATLGNGSLYDNGTVAGVNATGSAVSFYVQGTGALNPFIAASSTGHLILTTLANGNVTIGTDNGTNGLLTLSKENQFASVAPTTTTQTDNYITIGATESAANSYRLIGFGYNNPNRTYSPAYFGYLTATTTNNENGHLVFGTRSVTSDTQPTERLRITNDGRVGIATITPSALLTVKGFNTDGNTTTPLFLVASSTDTTYFKIAASGTTTVSKNLVVQQGQGIDELIIQPALNGSGTLFLENNADYIQMQAFAYIWRDSNRSAMMTLTSTDRLGIGSSTPIATLVAQGTSTSPTTPLLIIASSTNSSILQVNANGNIVLPNLSSQNCLGTDSSGILQAGTCSGGGGGAGAGWGTSTPQYITSNYPNSTTALVGINSSTPIANLVVQGISGSTTPVFVVSSSTGSNLFRVNSNGNVGISTSNPLTTLHVAQDYSGNSAVYVGTEAPTHNAIFGATLNNVTSVDPINIVGDYSSLSGNKTSLFVVDGLGGISLTNIRTGNQGWYAAAGNQNDSEAANFSPTNGNFGNAITSGSVPIFRWGGLVQGRNLKDNTAYTLIAPTFEPYSSASQYLDTSYTALNVNPSFAFNGAASITGGQWAGQIISPVFGSDTKAPYNATGTMVGLLINPTINVATSSTKGYAGLIVNPIETSTSTQVNYIALFQTNTTTKVTITSDGNVGIGSSTPSSPIVIASSTGTLFKVDSTGTIQQKNQISCSLGLTTDSSGNINGCVTSDVRLKDNIQTLPYNDILSKIRPVLYNWKFSDEGKDSQQHAGFIAQEVGQVLPQCEVAAGNEYFGVDANCMVANLWLQVQNLPQVGNKIKESAQDKWQNIALLLLFGYVIYNEVDKRKKKSKTI